MKQYILRKIREEETIIKIKFTNEEFLNYIIKFFEDFVQIFYSIPKKSLYISLVFEFNKIYIYSFNTKEYPDIPQRSSFFDVLKYTSIIVVCLVFMSKDLELYKKFSSKIKEPIEKFIFSMINIVGRNILKNKTINEYQLIASPMFELAIQYFQLKKELDDIKNLENSGESNLSWIENERKKNFPCEYYN